MKIRSSVVVFNIAAFSMLGCARNAETGILTYPNPRPDSSALSFLPGLVSTDSLDFNLAFSPDGMTIYFSRSQQGKWLILQATYDGKNWTSPTITPFSETDYSQADPFVTNEGVIYFISNRPRNANDTIPDFDIWYVKPLAGNAWSEPINVEGVNSDSTEYYVSVSSNGSIYFASNRTGGYGGLDIYMSKAIEKGYATPVNLGSGVNTPTDEHDPLILEEEGAVIFNSFERFDTYGEADLYYSLRKPDGTWSESKNMGQLFNTPTYEYCSNISPDKKYFFFSSEYDVKWINVQKLPFAIIK